MTKERRETLGDVNAGNLWGIKRNKLHLLKKNATTPWSAPCGGEWINQCILSLRLFTKRKKYIYIYCTAIHRPLVLMCRRGTTSLLDMFLTERLHRTEDSSTWFWPFHAELPDEIHQPRHKASAGDLGPLYVHDWSQLQQWALWADGVALWMQFLQVL